jgi:hypothetical protein
MAMRHWTVITLAAGLLSASPSWAAAPANTPASPPPCMKDNAAVPADYLALAGHILLTIKAQDRTSQLIDTAVPALVAVARTTSPNITDDQAKTLAADLQTELRSRIPALAGAEECIYVHHFSRDELKQLDAFYSSPLGQKMLAETPGLIAENVALGRNWAGTEGKAALDSVIAKMRKDGVKI